MHGGGLWCLIIALNLAGSSLCATADAAASTLASGMVEREPLASVFVSGAGVVVDGTGGGKTSTGNSDGRRRRP